MLRRGSSGGVSFLECADLSALFSQRMRRQAAADQSGDGSPHSKELTPVERKKGGTGRPLISPLNKGPMG